MVDQLRELEHSTPANSFSKLHDELKSTWETQLVNMCEVAKMELKDASVQTVPMEGDHRRFQNEGQREAWKERPADTMFSAEPQPENLCEMPGPQTTSLSFPSATDKVSFFIYYFCIYTNMKKLSGATTVFCFCEEKVWYFLCLCYFRPLLRGVCPS
jgi:hypothetical protein